MKKIALMLTAMVTLSLTACHSSPKLACNSTETSDAVMATLLEAATADAQTHSQAGLTIDASSVQSIFSQLKLVVEDARTDKTVDNKVSCTATLKIEAPAAMLNDANNVASLAKTATMSDVAQKMGMSLVGSVFKKDISFTAQQTDDGKKTKIDLFDLKSIAAVPSTLAYYALAKPAVDNKLAADAKAADDAQKANYTKAKTANAAANKAINELWNNLPPEVQTKHVEDEKAWVQKKVASCKDEAKNAAASAPANATANTAAPVAPLGTAATAKPAATVNYDAKIARLNCDTKMTKDRFNELQQLLVQ